MACFHAFRAASFPLPVAVYSRRVGELETRHPLHRRIRRRPQVVRVVRDITERDDGL